MLYSVSPYDNHDMRRHDGRERTHSYWDLDKKRMININWNTIKPSDIYISLAWPKLWAPVLNLCASKKKKKTLYRCMQGWGKFYSWSGFTTCVEAVKTNQWVHVYTLGGGQWKIKNRQWRWGMSRLRKRSTKPVQAHLLIKITALLFEQVTTKEDGWVVK